MTVTAMAVCLNGFLGVSWRFLHAFGMRAGKSGQIQWEECRVATSLTVTVGHKSLTDRSTVLVRRRDKLWKNIHNNLMPNSSSSSILFCGSKNQKLHAHHSRMETFSYSLIGLYMCFSLCTCLWSVDRISVQSGGMEKAGRQTGNLECMKNSIACMALVRNSSSSFFLPSLVWSLLTLWLQ